MPFDLSSPLGYRDRVGGWTVDARGSSSGQWPGWPACLYFTTQNGAAHTLGAQQAGSGLGTGQEVPPFLALRAWGVRGVQTPPPPLPAFAPLSSRPASLALLEVVTLFSQVSSLSYVSKLVHHKLMCSVWLKGSLREVRERGKKCRHLYLPVHVHTDGWLAGVLTEFPWTSVMFSMFLLIKFSFTPILIPSAYKLGWCWDSEVARGKKDTGIQRWGWKLTAYRPKWELGWRWPERRPGDSVRPQGNAKGCFHVYLTKVSLNRQEMHSLSKGWWQEEHCSKLCNRMILFFKVLNLQHLKNKRANRSSISDYLSKHVPLFGGKKAFMKKMKTHTKNEGIITL